MLATTLILLLVLFALSIPVAAALGLLGVSLSAIFSSFPLHRAIGEISWSASQEFLLVAVPLYVFMGELLMRSGVAERMYAAIIKWLGWLPGGLMHSNVASSAMFAATSGSSVATAATIGTLAMPEQKKYGYNERLFLGSLAAGGTLGILIPPSINMIVYGVLAEASIPKLYLAAFIPGLVLALTFMGAIAIACIIKPSWGARGASFTWREKISALPDLVPPLGIFILVIGSIYAGWATASESAALGVIAALGLTAYKKRLNLNVLQAAVEGTFRITGMTMLIVVGAFFLNFVLSSIGLTGQLVQFIQQLGWSPLGTILAICVFYIILGCFMDAFSVMVVTAPVIVPIVVAIGYDPIWFGVIMMLLTETGMITPPFGFNLFVIQSVRQKGAISDVAYGSLPFVVALLLVIGVLIAFPGIALWLPSFL
ncbi:TRAP transporter large permease [Hoeflea poritis]|uniref:TRAP transporter large permease protein n=1 Tax=Hoeflea poritis TaxID=2993659 RepID=A0ABT4VT28_9HYPH|nr:TRAP transporter large permease [Hoeflea poritis]MDA4847844.1 TRAP transporter large permease [Hoeflea poritis]